MVVRFDKSHFSMTESLWLGRNLAEARRAAGLSLGSLARRLRLPEVTLGAYEAGRARFPVRLLFAAARRVGVSPYHLVAGRADRVVNPWEPKVVEWHRLRRLEPEPRLQGPSAKEPEEDEPLQLQEVEGTDKGGGPREARDGDVEVLTGEEAVRAIRFIDGPGPSDRFEPGADDRW